MTKQCGECVEKDRLLGMSGEREMALRTSILQLQHERDALVEEIVALKRAAEPSQHLVIVGYTEVTDEAVQELRQDAEDLRKLLFVKPLEFRGGSGLIAHKLGRILDLIAPRTSDD